jgi:hypothetical protein
MRLRFEVQVHDDFNDPEEAAQQIAIDSVSLMQDDVCVTPKRGHGSAAPQCALSANNEHLQIRPATSITFC